MELSDLLGAAGALLIVGSYALLQSGRLEATHLGYSLANAVGAALILISLYYDFNLSATIVEGFWLLVSLYGIVRASKARAALDA